MSLKLRSTLSFNVRRGFCSFCYACHYATTVDREATRVSEKCTRCSGVWAEANLTEVCVSEIALDAHGRFLVTSSLLHRSGRLWCKLDYFNTDRLTDEFATSSSLWLAQNTKHNITRIITTPAYYLLICWAMMTFLSTNEYTVLSRLCNQHQSPANIVFLDELSSVCHALDGLH